MTPIQLIINTLKKNHTGIKDILNTFAIIFSHEVFRIPISLIESNISLIKKGNI